MREIDRAVIEINGGCNYTCQMCPQTNPDGTTGARGKGWLRKMPLDMFERAVAECAEAGLNVVNLDGSGEATLNRNLPDYISIVKKYGAKCYIFSNGFRMQDQFMHDCVDAGLDFYRFSIIGYNRDKYKEWMNVDNFDHVLQNLHAMVEYAAGTNCQVATYHLILDNADIEYEAEQYKKIVEAAGCATEIWKMHNWSGVYEPDYNRSGRIKLRLSSPPGPKNSENLSTLGMPSSHAIFLTPAFQNIINK